MHSRGNISARRASMVRPCRAVSSSEARHRHSIASGSHVTSALGTSTCELARPVVRQAGQDPTLLGNRLDS